MIEIRSVTKKFGSFTAVDDVSLDIGPGEAMVLLGTNGAGKSTLIKCVLGILGFEGEIAVCGLSVVDDPKRTKSLVGYVPQEPAFYDMSVYETMEFFGRLRGVGHGRIDELLEIVGLSDQVRKHSGALSGGMKQRLSIAIAMLPSSPVLILDEPTANLDPAARGELLGLVKTLKEEGKTILFSSHRLDEVEYLATRVAVMSAGRIMMVVTPAEAPSALGLRSRLRLDVSPESGEQARDILRARGYDVLTLGRGSISVEVESARKIEPIKALLQSSICVNDFALEEPRMDEAVDSGVGGSTDDTQAEAGADGA